MASLFLCLHTKSVHMHVCVKQTQVLLNPVSPTASFAHSKTQPEIQGWEVLLPSCPCAEGCVLQHAALRAVLQGMAGECNCPCSSLLGAWYSEGASRQCFPLQMAFQLLQKITRKDAKILTASQNSWLARLLCWPVSHSIYHNRSFPAPSQMYLFEKRAHTQHLCLTVHQPACLPTCWLDG